MPIDLSKLPFPVAYALHWAEQPGMASASARRSNLVVAAYQAMRLSALLMLADYLDPSVSDTDPMVAERMRGLRFPHWQEWQLLADELARFWSAKADRKAQPRFPGVVRGWLRVARVKPSSRARVPAPDTQLGPLVERLNAATGMAAGSAAEALWALRNHYAHRQGAATPRTEEQQAAELPALTELVHALCDTLFGQGEFSLMRARPGGNSDLQVLRLSGPHPDLLFTAEPCQPEWAEALAQTEVVALTADEALPIYPMLIPTDDMPATAAPPRMMEPAAMIDGISDGQLIVLGVENSISFPRGHRHLEASLAALRRKHADLTLERHRTTPWALAPWARMTAELTLDAVRGRKYFPASYLERHALFDALGRPHAHDVDGPCIALMQARAEQPARPLLLVGEAGSGKSSLIARMADCLLHGAVAQEGATENASTRAVDAEPGPDIVAYLTGRADYGGDPRATGDQLLVNTIGRKLGIRDGSFASLVDLLTHLNAQWPHDAESPRRSLWLLLDGLNEADRFVDLVRALDAALPGLGALPAVRLVVSLRMGAYLSLAQRDRTLGTHGAVVFDNSTAFQPFEDREHRSQPFLELRRFDATHEAPRAYALRQAHKPSAPVDYALLSRALRETLQRPLYLHLYHEAWAGDVQAPRHIGEGELIDAYLDRLCGDADGSVAGLGQWLLDLADVMLRERRSVLPLPVARGWVQQWREVNHFSSVLAVTKLDPIEEMVSASLLLRPAEEGLGEQRELLGYQFAHQKIAERVLLRALDRECGRGQPPTAEQFALWVNAASAGTLFADLAGALCEWVRRLVLAGDGHALASLLDVADDEARSLWSGALVQALAQQPGAAYSTVLAVIAERASGHPHGRDRFFWTLWPHADRAEQTSALQGVRPLFATLTRFAEEQAEADPGNAGFQRDLSVSFNKLGDLAVAAGDGPAAQDWFAKGLQIRQRLAEADPGNAGFQRDLSVSFEKLGDLAVAAGDGPAAQDWFAKGLQIAQRLAEADPGNAGFQRDLSVSFNKLGDLAVAAGDGPAAQDWFAKGLQIAQRLAEADPGNAGFQRDLWVSFNKLGELAVAAGDGPAAQDWFAKGLQIAQRLAEADPGNAGFQRDLSVSFEKLGDLAVAAGDGPAAQDWFAKGLQIAQRLAEADPGNAGFQRDLWVSFNKLGELAVAAGDGPAAQDWFAKGLQIAQRLAEADPGNAGFQRDLSVSFNKLGDLAVAAGDGPAAQDWFAKGLQIAQRLAEADPGNAGFQRDLSVSFEKLGDLAVAAGDGPAAQDWFAKGLQIAQRLAEADPGNAQGQFDVVVSHHKLASLAWDAGDAEAAARQWTASVDSIRRLASQLGARLPAAWRRAWASLLELRAQALDRLGRPEEAQADRLEARRLQGGEG